MAAKRRRLGDERHNGPPGGLPRSERACRWLRTLTLMDDRRHALHRHFKPRLEGRPPRNLGLSINYRASRSITDETAQSSGKFPGRGRGRRNGLDHLAYTIAASRIDSRLCRMQTATPESASVNLGPTRWGPQAAFSIKEIRSRMPLRSHIFGYSQSICAKSQWSHTLGERRINGKANPIDSAGHRSSRSTRLGRTSGPQTYGIRESSNPAAPTIFPSMYLWLLLGFCRVQSHS